MNTKTKIQELIEKYGARITHLTIISNGMKKNGFLEENDYLYPLGRANELKSVIIQLKELLK